VLGGVVEQRFDLGAPASGDLHHQALRAPSPWKLASTYALLSIAESLLAQQQPRPPGPKLAAAAGHKHGEILTTAEVAEMTRLSVATLRYWRHAGTGGPASFKLGRRVMYRRADVEKWLEEAQ
jgi:predicted DNA-binding transcriptional regulator AlpA